MGDITSLAFKTLLSQIITSLQLLWHKVRNHFGDEENLFLRNFTGIVARYKSTDTILQFASIATSPKDRVTIQAKVTRQML